MKTIGYVHGNKVVYFTEDKVTKVYGTHILLVGSQTEAEAIEQARRNLVDFQEV